MKEKNRVVKLKSKPIDKDGYPIKRSEICFKCGKKFCLTFSFSQQNYSQKHFLFYWSEKEEDKEKHICSLCLRLLYTKKRQEFLKIVNTKKQSHFRSYIARNII
ncbi:hypothetical protein GvMRE_I1g373 [endosymbiont GvMRE of Glomus versiforme]|nr:hypothetical protein GvMRE_Ic5g29 [endosymbiont GvMRE of Glomus versiforme]RHZ37452.1 hypothetical protein GvMRE_I1g373 [endosymbiont GvMRE of Glomus versiforme]